MTRPPSYMHLLDLLPRPCQALSAGAGQSNPVQFDLLKNIVDILPLTFTSYYSLQVYRLPQRSSRVVTVLPETKIVQKMPDCGSRGPNFESLLNNLERSDNYDSF